MKCWQFWTMLLVVALLVCDADPAAAYPCDVSPGDRVTLVVNQPDHPTLWAGMKGTVICFDMNPWDPWPVLVSFDDWYDGQWDTWWCTTPPISYVSGSLWPLACSEFTTIPRVPDLVDGGEPDRYFQPQTLIAGKANQTFEVRFRVVNAGPGHPLDSTCANVYASLDTTIMPSDYKLGTTTYFYLSGGADTKITLKVAFPTNIPAGFYYIGWIIDPADFVPDELDETNNTAYLSSYRLVVSAPAGTASLELSAACGGQINTPGEGVFAYPGTRTVSVAAVADPNCIFTTWKGTAVDAGKVRDPRAASTQVTVDAKYSLRALFDGAHLVLEDFEDYNEASPVNGVWVDGMSWRLGEPQGHRGNDTGATIGNAESPTAANPTVHGGAQAMAFHYNNSRSPYYSEASRRWGTLQNWPATGADKLSIWFRGAPSNSIQPLYAVVEDFYRKAAVVKHPDGRAVLAGEWTQWKIPLDQIQTAGVMMSRIIRLTLGVGEKGNPIGAGAGTLYFDDIALVHE